nr:MAG TPA_asm: hypothetical protein [Caudoviricetes sp.]
MLTFVGNISLEHFREFVNKKEGENGFIKH